MEMTKSEVAATLSRYKCHKEVRAFKITSIVRGSDRTPDPATTRLYREGDKRSDTWVEVDQAYMDKHQPKVGGYYVFYEDGYESFSPSEAFEAGYAAMIGV